MYVAVFKSHNDSATPYFATCANLSVVYTGKPQVVLIIAESAHSIALSTSGWGANCLHKLLPNTVS